MRPLNLTFWVFACIMLSVLVALWEHYGKRWKAKVCIGVGFLLWFCLIVVCPDLLDGVGFASWADLVDWVAPDGYVQHSIETSISAQQSWMVRETKDCSSAALDSETAINLGKEAGYVASSINCGDGPMHTITVNLYGRLNQPEHKIIHWRCTRESEGFTCRQTGAD